MKPDRWGNIVLQQDNYVTGTKIKKAYINNRSPISYFNVYIYE